MKNVWKFEKKLLISHTMAGIAVSLFSVAILRFLSDMTDFALAGNVKMFGQSTFILSLLVLFERIFQYIKDCFLIQCKTRCGSQIREKVCGRILNLNRQNEVQKSEILNLYNTKIELLQNYIVQYAEIPIALVTLAAAAVFMIMISFWLFLVSVVLIPVFGYAVGKLSKPMQSKSAEIIRGKGKLNFDMKQILEGFYIIKAYRLKERFLELFYNDAQVLKKSEEERDRMNSALFGRAILLLQYIPSVAIMLFGGWLCFRGEISVGEMIIANSVIGYIVTPTQSLMEIYKGQKEVQAVAADIENLLRQEQEMTEVQEKSKEKCPGVNSLTEGSSEQIKIQNLRFAYLETPVLKDVNLLIKEGQHVFLIGESGSGKSTLIRLLCGFETDFQGELEICGLPVCKKNIEHVRKQITYMPQAPYIFDGTLRENICMNRKITEECLRTALRAAALESLIKELPDGLDTLVGAGGIHLSGGQAKRVGIARTVAAEASIYILDEPMSALDPETACEVQKNLSAVLHGKTVLIVTHQPMKEWTGIPQTYQMEGGKIRNGAFFTA